MKTPFKLRSGNASSFKNLGSSPVKQEDFIKTNIAGQRVNMMGVPHGTPKSKLTDIGSLKPEHKGLYKQKGTMPKGFNVKGSSAAGTKILTKQEIAVNTKQALKNVNTISSKTNIGKRVVSSKLKDLGTKALKIGGKIAGGLAIATTLRDFYKSGQKHSGGKAWKGQKTGVVTPKKSIMEEGKKVKSILSKK